jgi:hypothetical protein
MNIPPFIKAKFVNQDGELSETWEKIMQQLFEEWQGKFGEEGCHMPQQAATNIARLDPTKTVGSIIYDNTNHKFMANVNGTYKELKT